MRYEEEFKKQANERIEKIKDEMRAIFRDSLLQSLRDGGDELSTGGLEDRDELMDRFEQVGLNHSVWDCTGLTSPKSNWMPQLPKVELQPGDRLLTIPQKTTSVFNGTGLTDDVAQSSDDDHKIELALNTAGLFPVLKGVFD